jgi:flagellar protein FlaG
MFEAIDHTAKSNGIRTIVSENATDIKNSKTNNAEATQKQQENRQENLQRKKGQKNISQEFLNELEKDIELIHNVRLKFTVHDATNRTMVKVIDKDTGKTIREVPSETILNIGAKIDEITGMLSNNTV